MKTKLIWQRSPQPGDDYALVLLESKEIDVLQMKKLFGLVKHAAGGRRAHLSRDATTAFDQWLTDVSLPLPSHAYARLSNWFLTEAEVDQESHLADRCRDFWNALFSARPTRRLTDIKPDNGRIVDIAFEVWWKAQANAQQQQ